MRGDGVMTVGGNPTPLGEHAIFQLLTPRPLGKRPIRILKVQVLGVRDGLVVDGLWGIRFSETSNEYIGAARGAAVERTRPHFHKVTEIAFDPRDGLRAQDWYVVAEVHTTRPGRFETTGFRVFAEVDGKKVVQSFDDTRLAMYGADPNTHPGESDSPTTGTTGGSP